MRKITNEAVKAFREDRNFKMSNTEVDVDKYETRMYLFGNLIARRNNLGEFQIRDGGHKSVTTKERLNGFPGVNIHQKNYQWYLNDEPWDGKWKLIK